MVPKLLCNPKHVLMVHTDLRLPVLSICFHVIFPVDFPTLSIFFRHVIEENSPYARLQKKGGGGGGGDRRGGWKKGASQSYADAIEESLMGLSLDGWDAEDEPSDKKRDDLLNVKELAARYPG